MSAELMPMEQPPPSLPAVTTPMAMLASAVERGMDPGTIEKLMALAERWDAVQARKAFDAAVAAAKGEIPPILKNRKVDFTSQKGRTSYKHEDLAEIARTVDPILNRHGLSYRFRAKQDGQRLTVTCVLCHRDGYSEETTLSAAEDHSGNKNSIQAIGSATSYLMRYTLKMSLGLSTQDDDGRSAGSETGSISEEQADTIRELITATGANVERFLAFMGAESVSDISAGQYEKAVNALQRKRGQA